jgi:hypothetical protein
MKKMAKIEKFFTKITNPILVIEIFILIFIAVTSSLFFIPQKIIVSETEYKQFTSDGADKDFIGFKITQSEQILNFYTAIVTALIGFGGVGFAIVVGNIENEKNRKLGVKPIIATKILPINEDFYLDIGNSYKQIQFNKKGFINTNGYKWLYKSRKLSEWICDLRREDNIESLLHFSIEVCNIGLETAFNLEFSIYELDSIKGYDKNDIFTRNIDNLYNRIRICNFKSYVNKKLIEDINLPLSPVTNLEKDKEKFTSVVTLYNSIKYPFKNCHTILEYVYTDVYNNKHYQYQYIYMSIDKFSFLPISKPYDQKHADKIKIIKD